MCSMNYTAVCGCPCEPWAKGCHACELAQLPQFVRFLAFFFRRAGRAIKRFRASTRNRILRALNRRARHMCSAAELRPPGAPRSVASRVGDSREPARRSAAPESAAPRSTLALLRCTPPGIPRAPQRAARAQLLSTRWLLHPCTKSMPSVMSRARCRAGLSRDAEPARTIRASARSPADRSLSWLTPVGATQRQNPRTPAPRTRLQDLAHRPRRLRADTRSVPAPTSSADGRMLRSRTAPSCARATSHDAAASAQRRVRNLRRRRVPLNS